jgi:hypothetical protein
MAGVTWWFYKSGLQRAPRLTLRFLRYSGSRFRPCQGTNPVACTSNGLLTAPGCPDAGNWSYGD